ncbi:enoyl-CoA hydratase/isomerase family protein [Actinomadura decatromicini]|uniref:Enoyl-CoA hydratase/isomerase family protein n=1 Tax=Actinomadura decatromicini TaxID=2604572 RepID=A0A5D3F8E5_9ACTN|nr:enoyl-CoA hydratase/isomerase family protein [Actinomadura decatromicini]TYK43990.1 enoyl-CoA hydratase/isomerase family protein [Actinomadura decatromicini]
MSTDLRVRREGSTMVVAFDRPEVLNAFRQRTYGELVAALDEAARDDKVGAVVLTGTGRAFSAGTDLKEAGAQLAAGTDADLVERTAALQDLTRRFTGHPKVIIAAVNGIAVGVGVELAIASDLRLAGHAASFAFKEVHRGLFPSNGVLYSLPRLVGHGRAVDLLLSGETIDAAEAYRAGLVSRLVPDGELLDTALELAERIAVAAPTPIRLIKEAMHRVWELDLEEVLDLETEGLLACLRSQDVLEGVRSFVERRPAVYRGA